METIRRGVRRRRKTDFLNLLAKVGAILTPILLAVGGWYFSALASDRDLTLKRFSESSALLSAISGQDIGKQRDALFSLIEIERPDLLRRSVAYLNANLEFEHTRRLASIQREFWNTPKPNKEEERRLAEDALYNDEKEKLLFPLVLAAIAAKDTVSVRILVDGAPTLLEAQRMVEVQKNLYNLNNLLDYAIDAGSRDLVEYFLSRGVQPHFWSVNKAIDSRDPEILNVVAQKTPRDFQLAWQIWTHVAAKGTASDVQQLAALGFARENGTAHGEPSIVAQAALAYRWEVVDALLQAGFPVLEISDSQPHELMSMVATKYDTDRYNISILRPDTNAFARTIMTICGAYRRQGISEADVQQRQRFTENPAPEQIVADARAVFESIFDAQTWEAFDCVAEFFAFDKLSTDDYLDLVGSAALHDGVIERLIAQYRFPINLTDLDGRNLALQIAMRGNTAALKFVAERGLNLKQLDKNGRGIYSAILDSGINKVDNRAIHFLQLRKLSELLDFAVSKVGIDFQDAQGDTAMMIATRHEDGVQMSEILRRNPNLNLTAADKQSVLSISAKQPQTYMELYSAGARAPGVIEDCEVFRALVQRIGELSWAYRPFDKDGKPWGEDRWNPQATARAGAPQCTAIETQEGAGVKDH
jgi:ankyrin repeat protein